MDKIQILIPLFILTFLTINIVEAVRQKRYMHFEKQLCTWESQYSHVYTKCRFVNPGCCKEKLEEISRIEEDKNFSEQVLSLTKPNKLHVRKSSRLSYYVEAISDWVENLGYLRKTVSPTRNSLRISESEKNGCDADYISRWTKHGKFYREGTSIFIYHINEIRMHIVHCQKLHYEQVHQLISIIGDNRFDILQNIYASIPWDDLLYFLETYENSDLESVQNLSIHLGKYLLSLDHPDKVDGNRFIGNTDIIIEDEIFVPCENLNNLTNNATDYFNDLTEQAKIHKVYTLPKVPIWKLVNLCKAILKTKTKAAIQLVVSEIITNGLHQFPFPNDFI